MKTYENKEKLLKAMFSTDVKDMSDVITNGLEDTDAPNMGIAKMACNVATHLVENAGGEARFDIEAIACDDEMGNIINQIKDFFSNIGQLVVSHGEITGIEVLNED